MDIVEQEAIRQVLAGHPEEYRVLMERHFPTVLRMTLRVTGSMEDAEEAAQEAFLLAYRKLPGFRNQSAFGTWVYRIAMNCSLNLVKRRTRDLARNAASLDAAPAAHEAAVSPHPTPEQVLLNAEAHLQRERAIATLTPMERTAFILRHLEEQPVDVIAHALGVSSNSARQTVFRAVSKLRRQLAPSRQNLTPALPTLPFLKEPQ